MKRLLVILFFLLIFASDSFAMFFIDGFGSYTNAGDLKSLVGGGAGFGFDINDNINFLFRTSYNAKTEDPNTAEQVDYSHMSFLGGFEIVPTIPYMRYYRLSWKTSFLAGISRSEFEMKDGTGAGEAGFACSFWTGIQYDVTQTISPFLDLGYHYSYYTDQLKDESIGGYQIALGIRFNLTGNRDYAGEYR